MVYKDVTNASKVTVILVNDLFKDVNNKLNTIINGECLYFNNKLLMSLNNNVRNTDDIMLPGFNNKEEVLKYLTKTGDLIVNSYLGDLVLTKKYFKTVYNFLTTDASFDPLLTHMLNHIESYIMTVDHFDYKTVISDCLKISDHIQLADNFALEFETFREFIDNEYDFISEELANEITKIYNVLLNNVYEHINLSNLNSISIKSEYNRIRIIEFESPAARRYKLNCEIIRDRKYGIGITDV